MTTCGGCPAVATGTAASLFAPGETLPRYLDRVNEEFVRVSRRLSPRVLIELLEHLGPQLNIPWAVRDLAAPADLSVSWAATDLASPAWLDIGREYTEFWIHQQQIGRPADVLGTAGWLHRRPCRATVTARAVLILQLIEESGCSG